MVVWWQVGKLAWWQVDVVAWLVWLQVCVVASWRGGKLASWQVGMVGVVASSVCTCKCK